MTYKRLPLFLLVALALAALTACGSSNPTTTAPTAAQPDGAYPVQPLVTLPADPGYPAAEPLGTLPAGSGYPAPGKEAANPGALQPLEMDGATIVYVRSGGLAGKTNTYRIYADGRVEADGNNGGKLTPEQVTALVDAAKTAGFFDLTETSFMAPDCRDCFTYNLAITADGKTVQVSAQDAATLPAPVSQMIQRMEETTKSFGS